MSASTSLAALAALCGVAAPLARTSSDAPALLLDEPWNLALDRGLLIERPLRLPSARSIAQLLEQAVQPAILGVEESGGFSDVDRERVSLLGDSWTVTRWYLADLDVGDPLFSGAAAFRLPFGLLDGLAVRPGESPGHARAGGIALLAGRDAGWRPAAGALVHVPDVGGIVPFARPLMDWISGLHGLDRARPPPAARRGVDEAQELFLSDETRVGGHRLRWGVEVERGRRRFLDLAPQDASLRGLAREPHARAAAALLVDDRHFLVAELRQRGRLFAEVGHAPAETLAERALTLSGGGHLGPLGAALTLTHLRLDARDDGFDRELLDPDGEARAPYFPDGDLLGANLDLTYRRGPYHAALGHRLGALSPATRVARHALTFRGAPAGTLERRHAPTWQLVGDHRVGVDGALRGPRSLFAWDLFATLGYAVNASGENGLAFPDVGLKARLELTHLAPLRLFAVVARQPLPPTPELARTLDPGWMETRLSVPRAGGPAVVDTTGGAWARVAHGLRPVVAHAAAIGLEAPLSARFKLVTQAIGRAHVGPLRLELDGPAEAAGIFVNGVHFLNPGDKRYVLVNARDHVPLSWGWHIQVVGEDPGRWFASVSFSAYNAIGRPTFGNGSGANDVGVVDFAGASPNARRGDLANVDGDRAFQVKAAVGAWLLPSLLGSLTLRHRDGQPFAFLEGHLDDGQAAFTYRTRRGSPLDYVRPFSGPREDFQLQLDAQLAWTVPVGGLDLVATLAGNNLLDLGNELGEVQTPPLRDGRVSLEMQIPRTLLLGLELRR